LLPLFSLHPHDHHRPAPIGHEGGAALDIRAGDTLFFPAHTRGQWHVHQTLRKVFVVMAA
jgi:uncharacterized cupin superfamily protein